MRLLSGNCLVGYIYLLILDCICLGIEYSFIATREVNDLWHCYLNIYRVILSCVFSSLVEYYCVALLSASLITVLLIFGEGG